MRLRDHAPPHFHAFYGEYSASIEIGTHTLMKGRLPPRIRRMVESWGEMRENELRLAWKQIRNGKTPGGIAPPA